MSALCNKVEFCVAWGVVSGGGNGGGGGFDGGGAGELLLVCDEVSTLSMGVGGRGTAFLSAPPDSRRCCSCMSLFKPSTSHLTAMKEATDGVAGIIRAQGAAGRLYALLETRPKMERGEGSRKGGREGGNAFIRKKQRRFDLHLHHLICAPSPL